MKNNYVYLFVTGIYFIVAYLCAEIIRELLSKKIILQFDTILKIALATLLLYYFIPYPIRNVVTIIVVALIIVLPRKVSWYDIYKKQEWGMWYDTQNTVNGEIC